ARSRRPPRELTRPRTSRFNPTLVRLRKESEMSNTPNHKFQSHAGSIEGLLFVLFLVGWLGVSIPRWFD
ncbi:MAG: hypothetical protein NZ572_08290, partial [Thermoflexus sp.]|nr:hypothetical protein [Thermoflexus sp.]